MRFWKSGAGCGRRDSGEGANSHKENPTSAYRIPRPTFLLFLLATNAFATHPYEIQRLSPIAQPATPPAECRLQEVLPDSPAQKAGLQVGDVLQEVNGQKPANAVAISDMIELSGPEAVLDVAKASGEKRQVKVPLNKNHPRLGVLCDLTGWRQGGVTSAGNESVTIFEGPYSLTASGAIDKKLVFMRLRVANHSASAISVDPDTFTVTGADNAPIPLMSPQEVMRFLHGESTGSLIKPPLSTRQRTVETSTSSAVPASPAPSKKESFSQEEKEAQRQDARYLSQESLWPTTAEPSKVADGLVYFKAPAKLPFTLHAFLNGGPVAVSFGNPAPEAEKMSRAALTRFFESQKKGTPLRLTLRNQKVFSGRFSSYDPDNETVWFDTASGGMLNSSSFALKTISSAQAIEQKPESEAPPPDAPR